MEKKGFKCHRCGYCCSLSAELTNEDTDMLKKARVNDFSEKRGIFKKKYLKKINGRCKFLLLKDGIASCSLEKTKPFVCKRYPKQKGLFGTYRDIRCRTFRFNIFN